jgi:hypothetical protein
LGNKEKSSFRNLIKAEKPILVLLHETILDKTAFRTVKNEFCKGSHEIIKKAWEASRCLTLWDPRSLSLDQEIIGDHWITACFTVIYLGQPFWLKNAYAPNTWRKCSESILQSQMG